MPAYKAPLHDIRFLMNEVLDYPTHYKNLSNGELADADTVDMILEGAADFCENVLSPRSRTPAHSENEPCSAIGGQEAASGLAADSVRSFKRTLFFISLGLCFRW